MLALVLGLLAVTCAVCLVCRALDHASRSAQLVDTMATLAKGQNDIEVPGTERGDEIGHMARAVLVFRDAAIEKNRLEAASADQQAASEVERQRNEAAQGRRGGAGQARRRCARRRARAARQGRAHLPDHRGVRRRIQEGAERLQRGHRPVAGDHRCDRDVGARGLERRRRDLVEHDRPVAADRGAGGEPGRDLRVDGADLRDGEAERGERPAGQPVRGRHPRGLRSRRRGGRGSGQGDVADRGIRRARSPTSSA